MDKNMCCVSSCKNIFRPGGRKFYRLPLGNKLLLNSWLNAMGNEEKFVPSSESMICSAHFIPSDYYIKDGCIRIRQSAIPSKSLKCPQSSQSINSKNNVPKKINKSKSFEHSSVDHPYAKHVTWTTNVSNSLPVIVSVKGQVSDISALNNSNTNNYSDNLNEDCMIVNEISRPPATEISNKFNLGSKVLKKIQPKVNNSVKNSQIPSKMFVRKQTGPVVPNQMYLLVSTKRDQNGLPTDVQLIKTVQNDEAKNQPNTLVMPAISKPANKVILDQLNVKILPNNIINNSNLNKNSIKLKNMLQPEVQVKHTVPPRIAKKIKALNQKNRRLNSRIQSLMVTVRDLQDIQIKYLKLKERLLDTEEKLLMKGIDTSEYSAFCDDKKPVTPIKKKKTTVNKSQNNMPNDMKIQSTEKTKKHLFISVSSPTYQVQENNNDTSLFITNKNVMSEHSYGVISKVSQKYFT
ncbi:uncharacterized protein LOC126894021 [Daktulosphaira vitifoliae]|uniref:uncharacterized protein LOC126894021 n=1 Tax=Daktulosphaira vitifoliae TaxID=58002 RepID=UPI0021A9F4EB|nr:uncharacterized protein LOC126894021 [Daktulosphaira vitifoliae]